MAVVAGATIAAGLTVAGGMAAGAATAVIVAQAVTTFVITLSSSLIARSKQRDVESYTSEQVANQTILRSSVESVKLVYGEAVVSGLLAYTGVSGNDNEYLHMVIVLTGHEVHQIGTVYFDEKPEDHEDISQYVEVWRHNGEDDQPADAVLMETFGDWTAAHRLQGCAYLHVKIKFDEGNFFQVPNVKARVRGRKVVDTRIAQYNTVTGLILRGNDSLRGFEQVTGIDKPAGFFFKTRIGNVDFGAGDKIFLSGNEIDDSKIYYLKSTNTLTVEFYNLYSMSVYVDLDLSRSSISIEYRGSQIHFTVNSTVITRNVPEDLPMILWRTGCAAAATRDIFRWSCSSRKEDDYNFDFVRFGDVLDGDTLKNYGVPNDDCEGNDAQVVGGTMAQLPALNVEEYHRIWSKNSALNVFDYMTWGRYGMGVDYNKMDLPGWEYAADLSGENRPDIQDPCPRERYTLDGVVDTATAPGNNLSRMMSSCGGVVTWTWGKFTLFVASPSPSVFTITSDMITSSIDFQVVKQRSQTFNSVKAIYVSALENWQAAETPIYRDEAAIIADRNEILTELDLPFTDNTISAQRLARTFLNLSRLEGAISLSCKYEAFGLKAMDVVTVNAPEMGIDNELFRVGEWLFDPPSATAPGSIPLMLLEYDAEAYDIPDDEIRPPHVPPELPQPGEKISPPSNFTAYSNASTVDPNTGHARVILTWLASPNIRCDHYEITAEIQGVGGYTVIVPGRTTETYTDPIPENEQIVIYTIQAVRDDGLKSSIVSLEHVVSDGSGAPGQPSGFQIVGIDGNLGSAIWSTTPDPNRSTYELRIGEIWEKSEYIGSRETYPILVPVTGMGLTYFLAARGLNGDYSTPATTTATPSPDWWNPVYDWGLWRWSSSRVFSRRAGMVAHPGGAIVRASQVSAAAQDWETFDIFVEDPEETATLYGQGYTLEQAGTFYAYGNVFTQFQPVGYPDDTTTPAQAQLVYSIMNLGVWSSPVILPAYGFEYEVQTDDTQIAFGVLMESDKDNGFVNDFILRVGASYPA